MRLVLATNHMGLGGSESYLLTVAEQLDRLGQEVVLFSPEGGDGVEMARARGIDAVRDLGSEGGFDAAIVQDAGVALQLADCCCETPQLFVAHSEMFDLQAPPQLDGVVGKVVALNDRVARRMRNFAVEVEVVRLRQPIDTERFSPPGPLPEKARRALLLSNTPHADRLGILDAACVEAGLALKQLGGLAGQTEDIRPALHDADIVIGYGRSILEAMSCGRAAYVYDWNGGEGWVTPRSYPAVEADGIAGRSGREIVDAERLAADLRRYAASMGPVNRDLAIGHHRANVHAQELLELLRGMESPPPRPRTPLQEMARLVRLEWRARVDASGLVQENTRLRTMLEEQHRSAEEAWAAVGERNQRIGEGMARVAETARAYESSASWRLTRPLRALGSAIRRGGRRWGRLRTTGRRRRPPSIGTDSDATTKGRGSHPPSQGEDPEKCPAQVAPRRGGDGGPRSPA